MKWLDLILDILAGLLTKESLKVSGASKDALQGAVTTRMDVGSFHDEDASQARYRVNAVAFMRSQLGKGYQLGVEVEGEESPLWDCSEVTQGASRHADWEPRLPDGAQAQYDFCRPVRNIKAGDLGFLWSDKRKMIGHVWMYTGEGTVIHAMGGRGVVEDNIDDLPRLISDYHRRFRGVRRAPCFSTGEDSDGLAG